MKHSIGSGAVAIAAVSLALDGAETPAAAQMGQVHCLGTNSCKGKTDCHTPKNACKA